MARKYIDGEIVTAGEFYRHKMIVLSATECLKGWRYKLGWPKKDGTLDKRRTTLSYFEDQINAK